MVELKNDLLRTVWEDNSPEVCADRPELGRIAHLKTLACRLEGFLLAQIDRLECCDGREGSDEVEGWDEREAGVSVEDDLARQLDGFQQERADWECQRQCEVDRLRRESTLLAEAWRRLESEQRSLLAERELLRQGLAAGSPSAVSRDAGPSISQPVTSAAEGAAASSTHEQDHTMWLQFQQLRREMQRHGRSGT